MGGNSSKLKNLSRKVLVENYGKDNLINETEIKLDSREIRNINSNTSIGLTKLLILSLSYNEIEEMDLRLFDSSRSNLTSLVRHRRIHTGEKPL